MKKYNYTEVERAQMAEARKNNRKGLAKIVYKIRKTCIAEGRFTEVEDNHSEKESVEVHGAEETSVIIK